MKTSFPRMILAAASVGLVVGSATLPADDVTDAIDEAVKAYNDKDYATATQSLEIAAQLVRQMRAEGLTAFLPSAPSGWNAEDADSSAAGGSMFGGMVSAQREYRKSDSWAKVQFITDSPALQGFIMMMNMPMMASSDGGKLVTIKRQKAIVKYRAGDKAGSINIVVGGRLLVQIEGTDLTDAELKAFAEAIDYEKLAAAI